MTKVSKEERMLVKKWIDQYFDDHKSEFDVELKAMQVRLKRPIHGIERAVWKANKIKLLDLKNKAMKVLGIK